MGGGRGDRGGGGGGGGGCLVLYANFISIRFSNS